MLTTLLLTLAAVAAGLLAVAGWWIYRTNLAVQPKGRRPLHMRPLPTGCDIGERLMMAAATGTTGSSSRPAGGGGSRRTRKGPSRRAFLRGSMFGAMGVFLGGFGGASLAFLWPNLAGGFGAVIDIGDEETIRQFIRENRQPWEAPEGRLYLVEYDASEDREDEYHDVTDGGQATLMALFQTCVHLGCRVPWCDTSQWFECPCHGSRYNRWGEYRAGPAGRGLDRFALTIEDGRVIVDTSEVITGPSRAMNSLEQPPEGPSCV